MRRFSLALLGITLLMSTGAVAAQNGTDNSANGDSYVTYHRLDGNRYIAGTGTFPEVQAVNFPLDGTPMWIVGYPTADAQGAVRPAWLLLLEDGSMQGTYYDEAGDLQLSRVEPDVLPPGTPPVVRPGMFTVLEFSMPADTSMLTHPVRTAAGMLYVASNQDIVLTDNAGAEVARFVENALPDARIVVNDAGLAAVYTGATNERYVHGIMGDDLEAAALTVIDMEQQAIFGRIELPGEAVFEGIAPFWADLNADGVQDLVTTVSFPGGGAQLRAYAVDGTLIASSDPVGSSNRWRHQLAWGPFGAAGENRLVEVLTPHIGGIVGFFAVDGDQLVRVASIEGYTSHVIGSRNLDMAVAGDFDGDGQPEIVLADQQRQRIAGLTLTPENTIREAWTLPLDGMLATNLAAVNMPDTGLALAAGISDNQGARLRVWIPQPQQR
jgi:hypothetical protein